MPGINESPCLENLVTHTADTYEPSGPFGAKGIGEAATNPVAAAYANTIRDATGIRFYELPITPEKILAGLRGIVGGAEAQARPPAATAGEQQRVEVA